MHCACLVSRFTRVVWFGVPRPCLVIDELRCHHLLCRWEPWQFDWCVAVMSPFRRWKPWNHIDVSCWVNGVFPLVQIDTRPVSLTVGWYVVPLVQIDTRPVFFTVRLMYPVSYFRIEVWDTVFGNGLPPWSSGYNIHPLNRNSWVRVSAGVQFSSDFRSGKREDVKTRSSTIGKRGVGVLNLHRD